LARCEVGGRFRVSYFAMPSLGPMLNVGHRPGRKRRLKQEDGEIVEPAGKPGYLLANPSLTDVETVIDPLFLGGTPAFPEPRPTSPAPFRWKEARTPSPPPVQSASAIQVPRIPPPQHLDRTPLGLSETPEVFSVEGS